MTTNRLPRRPGRLACATGMSLAEITVILSVLSIVGATLTPALGTYVNDARMTKAQDDVRVLATAVARLAFDIQHERGGPFARLVLLVGPGGVPSIGAGGDDAWVRPAGGGQVAFLDDHLLTNAAGHEERTPAGLLRHGWRGPYLGTPIGADPWGRRYAVNVATLSDDGRAVVVLSAGKDGMVDTPFAVPGPTAGGDDVAALVVSGGL